MTVDVCIVGGGLRAVALIERLGRHTGLRGVPLTIAVVEPYELGVGRIWRVDQPPSLVMNNFVTDATAFIDESVETAAGPFDGPTFAEWIAAAAGARPLAEFRPAARARFEQHDPSAALRGTAWASVAAAITPQDLAPRGLFGAYLRWYAALVLGQLPESVSVRHVRAAAHRVDRLPGDGGFRVAIGPGPATSVDGGGFEAGVGVAETPAGVPGAAGGAGVTADAVVLSLGWIPAAGHPAFAAGDPSPAPRGAAAAGPRRIAADSPIDQDLSAALPGSRVLLRGQGLSFIDLVSLLTEGRGGRFEGDERAGADAHGRPLRLRYAPSGREPRLFAGSRLGAPFLAKPAWARAPRVPAATALQALAADWDRDRVADFDRDIWPAVETDALIAYYETLAEHRPAQLAVGIAELRDRLLRETDAEARAAYLAAAVPDERARVARIDRTTPLQTGWHDAASYRRAVRDYLAADVDECMLAEASARKSLYLSLNYSRPLLSPLVQFGGLSAEGVRQFRRYGKFVQLVGGVQPYYRNQQLLALVDAGLLEFLGRDLSVAETGDGFVVDSAAGTCDPTPVDLVVDAWVERADARRPNSPLVRGLVESGLARAYDAGAVGDRGAVGGDGAGAAGAGALGEVVPTQSVEIDPRDSALIGRDGSRQEGLFSVGVTSEDQRTQTIFAPMPDSDADMLRELDATAASAVALIGRLARRARAGASVRGQGRTAKPAADPDPSRARDHEQETAGIGAS